MKNALPWGKLRGACKVLLSCIWHTNDWNLKLLKQNKKTSNKQTESPDYRDSMPETQLDLWNHEVFQSIFCIFWWHLNKCQNNTTKIPLQKYHLETRIFLFLAWGRLFWNILEYFKIHCHHQNTDFKYSNHFILIYSFIICNYHKYHICEILSNY